LPDAALGDFSFSAKESRSVRFDRDGVAFLELHELIRVNQLVRSHIDFDAFRQWYDSLSSVAEQSALVGTLIEFALQAGYDDQMHQEAASAAQIDIDHPMARMTVSHDEMVEQAAQQGYQDGYTWLTALDDTDRFTLFRLFVYLFGKAERRRYQSETLERCNHWWHRDLLDERVVQAVLSDPEYYRTSRRDDDPIKGRNRASKPRPR
jgi:hypothetical protein